MKCKKIFAMLLALCMVLSTFVAVSAEDAALQVAIDIDGDFEDGLGNILNGNGDLLTLDVGTFGGRDGVLSVTSSGQADHRGIVGYAVENAGGEQYTEDAFPTEGTLEYSYDIMAPDTSVLSQSPSLYLRTGTWAPSGNMSNGLNANASGLVAGEWKTVTRTIDLADFAWTDNAAHTSPVWLCVRPYFGSAGTVYLDNIKLKVSVPEPEVVAETVVDMDVVMTEDDSVLKHGANASEITYDNGIASATLAANDHHGQVGVKLVDSYGRPYAPKAGDELSFEAEIKTSVALTFDSSLRGFLLRRTGGPDTDFGSQNDWKQIAPTGPVAANTWQTFTGSYTFDEAFVTDDDGNAAEAVTLSIRPNVATTLEIKSFKVVVKSTEELPPYIPGGDDDDDDDQGGNTPGGDDSDDPVGPQPVLDEVVGIQVVMDEENSKLLKGSQVSSLTYADGKATAVFAGTGNNAMVGVRLVDSEGSDFALKAGDVVEYSVKLKSTAAFQAGANGIGGLMIRAGGTNYPPSNPTFARMHTHADVTANQWKTLSGSWTCDKDYAGTTYVSIRPEVVTTVEIEEFKISIKKEAIPSITGIEFDSATADSAKFVVETEGYIDSSSIKDYVEINGVAWDANKVNIETVDENTIKVTVKGLVAGVAYDFTLAGADSLTGGNVPIDCDDTVAFKTKFEITAEAEFGETAVTYTLENNTAGAVNNAYVVLLRCVNNKVIATEKVEKINVTTNGANGNITITTPLANGEYFRLFVWSYDGAIRALADVVE